MLEGAYEYKERGKREMIHNTRWSNFISSSMHENINRLPVIHIYWISSRRNQKGNTVLPSAEKRTSGTLLLLSLLFYYYYYYYYFSIGIEQLILLMQQ